VPDLVVFFVVDEFFDFECEFAIVVGAAVVEDTSIGGLSASLGVEDGFVEKDQGEGVFGVGLDVEDCGSGGEFVGVGEVFFEGGDGLSGFHGEEGFVV